MGFTTYSDVKAGYLKLWNSATIRPEHAAAVKSAAESMLPHKDRYAAAAKTVPWWFSAIIHHREGGGNFNTHLHNGDPLTARTIHVPAGRPLTGEPPFTWEESAHDALQMQGFTEETDWSFPKACWNFERMNGFGYVAKKVNSPYVWSFTTNYSAGKFVADHVFDANAVDQQIGAAAILKYLIQMGEVTETAAPAVAVAAPKPKVDTMSDLQTFLKNFAGIAPTLATLIAGPGAGLAVKVVAEALNMDIKSDATAVHDALDSTPPSKVTAIITAAEQIAASLQPPAPVPATTPSPAASVPAVVAPADAPVYVSPLDALFPALTGWKTIIGVALVGAISGAHAMGLFPALLTDANTIGLETFVGGFLIGPGLIAKIDRFTSAFSIFKTGTAKA